MKNAGTIIALSVTIAITVFGAFAAQTVIHQTATFAGGSFAVLSILAVFVVRKMPESETKEDSYSEKGKSGITDDQIISAVRSMKDAGHSDSSIAATLRVDIDVVKTILT